MIGLLLAIVAIILIIESRNLLIGESAYKEKVQSIYEIVNNDYLDGEVDEPLIEEGHNTCQDLVSTGVHWFLSEKRENH